MLVDPQNQAKQTIESFHLTGDLLQSEITQPGVVNNLVTIEYNSTLSQGNYADHRSKPFAFK
jgi:hypothetical protein